MRLFDSKDDLMEAIRNSTVQIGICAFTNTFDEKNIQINNSITEFYYKPEELLPGDGDATNLHENHYNLITNIVNIMLFHKFSS